MVLWDEAWTRAKDQDEEKEQPALNCVMRKAVFQGFGGFCVVIGSLSRHPTFYDSQRKSHSCKSWQPWNATMTARERAMAPALTRTRKRSTATRTTTPRRGGGSRGLRRNMPEDEATSALAWANVAAFALTRGLITRARPRKGRFCEG